MISLDNAEMRVCSKLFDIEWYQQTKKLMLQDVNNDKINFVTLKRKRNSDQYGGVVCVDRYTGKTGISKCHIDDVFNYYIGRIIAYSRLRDIEIKYNNTISLSEAVGCKIVYNNDVKYVVPFIYKVGFHLYYPLISINTATFSIILLPTDTIIEKSAIIEKPEIIPTVINNFTKI